MGRPADGFAVSGSDVRLSWKAGMRWHARMIKEAKERELCVRDKSNFRQPPCFEAVAVLPNFSQPADPNKFHNLHGRVLRHGPDVVYARMEDSEHERVSVRVRICTGFGETSPSHCSDSWGSLNRDRVGGRKLYN